MRQTLRDRIHQWVVNIPWRYTMWLAYRRQARDRARFQQDY